MQTREINFAINASKNIVAEWKTAVWMYHVSNNHNTAIMAVWSEHIGFVHISHECTAVSWHTSHMRWLSRVSLSSWSLCSSMGSSFTKGLPVLCQRHCLQISTETSSSSIVTTCREQSNVWQSTHLKLASLRQYPT